MKRKAKYITEDPPQLRCPVCAAIVKPDDTYLQQMENWLKAHWFFAGERGLVQDAIDGKFKLWACRNCERKKRAIFPDYNKQNHGYGGPVLFYITKGMTCETCKKDFSFTAEEQRFWYEDLYFNYASYPKNCLSCRKETREKKLLHKKLAELLRDDPKTSDQMLSIAKVYKELGIEEKAVLYLARAKNLER